MTLAYRSLYDMVERTRSLQRFEGRLESILDDIVRVLKKKDRTGRDHGILVFQTPRIIRALLDFKEENPDDPRLLRLLRLGVDTSLSIYRRYDDPTTIDGPLGLRNEIAKASGGILERALRQYPDDISLVASEPCFSQATARELAQIIGSEQAMLFVTAHGAIGAGLDVVLRYEEVSCRRNLEFYPVRYSRSENKGYRDTEPRLTPAEIEHLRKAVNGKRVIVFDENRCTGKTLETVAEFISKEVAPDQDVNTVCNVNTGAGGVWVELYCRLQDNGRLIGAPTA
jgi:hypothetical protein